MSDVALVYPYVHRHAAGALLFYPTGMAQLGTLIRMEGLEVSVVDLTFRGLDEALHDLESSRPRIVGMYVAMTMVDNARALARRIRRSMPDAVLACGGPMPTVRPRQFLADFDVVFRGESLISFPRFCRDILESGSLRKELAHPGRYPGISHAGCDQSAWPPSQPIGKGFLDSLPAPDLKGFDHDRYQRFWKDRSGFSPACIMTTYGCPYECEFCSKPIFGNLFRTRGMESIMQEIRAIRLQGYDGLWVADDCFTLSLPHVRRFCRMLERCDFNMTWTCLSRAQEMPAEDIQLMRRAGCRKVYFGLESGSDEVLGLMKKRITVAEAARAVELFARGGIETAGFFMIGYPGETRETIETTLRWALSLPLDDISFTVPVPLPGTGLFERVREVRPDVDWAYENENRMIYRSEFPEEYLQSRIHDTLERFQARKRQLNV